MNLRVDWQLLIEALKEPARWFVLSVVSFVVTLLLENVPGISDFLFTHLGLSTALTTTAITYILRAVDKYLYRLQKEKTTLVDSEPTYHGLVGF